MRISLPVLKRNAPSARARSMTARELVDVETGGRERDFERQAGRPHRAAGGMHLGERAAGALALVGLLGVAVEADLDRADRQRGEACGDRRVEALSVGLDLELDARRRRALPPPPGNAGRPAARRRTASRTARRCATMSSASAHRFVGVELVGQALARRRLGAAVQAAEVAVAGELPGHEQRPAQAVDATRHPGPPHGKENARR